VCISVILLAAVRFSVAGQTVDIGLLIDLSGSGSEAGKAARWACEMAVDHVNAQGGVGGRLVGLTVFDTRGDPLCGSRGARELVLDRRVSAVVGPMGWDTAMMAKPFFQEIEVPAMMLTSEDSVIRGGKYGLYGYIFQLPIRQRTSLERIGTFVQRRGWTRIGLVTESDGAGREAQGWFTRVGPAYGIDETVCASLGPKEDTTESLRRLVDRDLPVIVSWCSLPHAAAVTQILRGLGFDRPLFLCHEILPHRYVSMVGPDTRESLIVTNKMLVWEDLDDTDPQRALIRDFVHQYRDVYGYAARYPVCPFLGYVWDSAMILVRAMREAGTDGTDMRDAIEATYHHVGLGGIYSFSYEDHNGLNPDSAVIARVDHIRGDGKKWVGSWRVVNECARMTAGSSLPERREIQ